MIERNGVKFESRGGGGALGTDTRSITFGIHSTLHCKKKYFPNAFTTVFFQPNLWRMLIVTVTVHKRVCYMYLANVFFFWGGGWTSKLSKQKTHLFNKFNTVANPKMNKYAKILATGYCRAIRAKIRDFALNDTRTCMWHTFDHRWFKVILLALVFFSNNAVFQMLLFVQLHVCFFFIIKLLYKCSL